MPDSTDHSPSAGKVDLDRTTDAVTPVSPEATTDQHKSGTLTELYPPSSWSESTQARYRILRPHATGGLGEVFVAEDMELHREVALKEIRPQHAHDIASRNRFVREAEITGRLEHPGIVPIYGLGIHPDGRPFYAMRFIKGDNLKEETTRFHNADVPGRDQGERSLAMRALLRRFVDVCNAVAYAHSRGVLHRDLKPANVMVGVYGETFVVDWGLAKAGIGDQDVEVGGQSEVGNQKSEVGGQKSYATDSETQAGSALGTPGFMSPEQAAGRLEDIGPTSDVYSLGATLYYLLTGSGPFRDIGFETAIEWTRSGHFPRPSKIKTNVPRALEAVCLKAMATRPEDRYQTARDLSDDIEHWLADEPVAAYGEPWRIRLARWGRRHRTVVAAAAALLLTAVIGLTIGLLAVNLERTRTQEEKERAETALASEEAARKRTRQALDDMTSQVIENWMARKDKLEPAQQEFLDKALASYEEFTRETGDRQEVRRGVAGAHGRVGRIHNTLGRMGAAEAAFRRSVELFEQLAADFPSEADYRRQCAGGHHNLGVLLVGTGRFKEGEECYRKALDIRKRLVDEFPEKPLYRNDVARNHNLLGNLYAERAQWNDAEAAFREAVAIQKQLVADVPQEARYRSDLALTYFNLGPPLVKLNRHSDADAAYRESIALLRQLVEESPAQTEEQRRLARSLGNLGVLLTEAGQMDEAQKAYREALVIRKRLADDFPAVASYRHELSVAYRNLADHLRNTDRPDEAEPAHQAAISLGKQLVADHPGITTYRDGLADSYLSLGVFLYQRGRLSESEAAYRECLAIKKQLAAEFPMNPTYRHEVVMAQYNLGLIYQRLGRIQEAEASYRDAVAILKQLVAEYPSSPRYKSHLVVCQTGLGELVSNDRPAEAEAAYREALAVQQKLVAEFPNTPQYRQELGVSHQSLADLLQRASRLQEAEVALTDARAIREKLVVDFPNSSHYRFELASTLNALARLKLDARRFAEARALLEQAQPQFDAALKANPNGPGYRPKGRGHRALLAQVFAGTADYDSAMRTAEEIAKLGWEPAADIYNAACAFARCGLVVDSDQELSEADRRKHTAAFADRAVLALKDAIEKGFKDVDKLKKDKDLEALRSRDDFQKLITELESKIRPDGR